MSLHRCEIDVDAAVGQVVAGSGYPDRQQWADFFVRVASDAEALTTFAPRDGRQPL